MFLTWMALNTPATATEPNAGEKGTAIMSMPVHQLYSHIGNGIGRVWVLMACGNTIRPLIAC